MLKRQSELTKFALENTTNNKVRQLVKALEEELEHLTHSLIYAIDDTTSKQLQGGCQFCTELIKIFK